MDKKYIDLDVLVHQIFKQVNNPVIRNWLFAIINKIPFSDVQEVRHGRWTDQYNNGDWHCSECGAIVEVNEQINHNWYYCYHCGARMGGDS